MVASRCTAHPRSLDILLYFCIACVFLFTQVSLAETVDIKSRIDGLVQELGTLKTPNDVRKNLADLRRAITALEEKAPDDLPAFVDRADETIVVAKRLASGGGTIPPSVAAKTVELVAQVQPLELGDPTKAAIARAQALLAALPNVISTYPPLRTAVVALFAPLEAVEEVDFLEAVKRRSNSLNILLTKAKVVGPPTSLEAIAAVMALDAAIFEYRKHADPMVDIVYAEYGDMRDNIFQRNRRPQLCDVTDKIRKDCQGHLSCALPDPTKLCSADPAPFISAAHKGVRIQFRCVDALLKVYAPPALASMVPGVGNSNWATLRTAGEEFRCAPARAGTGK